MLVGLGVAATGFAACLGSPLTQDVRGAISGVGLLVGGAAATVSGGRRAWLLRGSAGGRPWFVLATAGVVLLVGNGWVAATGADPVTAPSQFSNASIAVALLLSVLALVMLPGRRPRGYQLMVMLLDGLVAGGAFLLIASVLVYSRLLSTPVTQGSTDRVFALLFPALDVLLATFAVLLVVRASRSDRTALLLVATAFLLYAASDLMFAVRTNEGTFHFGTLLDLGWILGYLALAAAAWTPLEQVLHRGPGPDRASCSPGDALGTTLVFAVLVVATLVQVLFGADHDLRGVRSGLWVVIVLAAGTRQVLLTIDNSTLRRGLERRVDQQTAHLRNLARQNQTLINSVGDGIFGVDAEGVITFVNPSGAALLGYTAAELVGRSAHETLHATPAGREPHLWRDCYIHTAIHLGLQSTDQQDDYQRSDDTTFPVELTASPLAVDSGFRGAVVVFRDVTQRREVDRMKNEFLSVVSHELRTPLTSIQGSLGLLAGGRLGELPERAAPLVTVALRASERLTRLINDLLDIERLESGTSPLEVTARDARALLDAAASQMEGMAASMAVGVEVAATARGRVLVDEDQIMQTLINLLGNAVKFSDQGAVVRLDAVPRAGDVLFSVSDDGRGIPADKLEAVFDRFEQVDSSDTRQRGGTGLGLTISRGIVTRHGGQIWAESELGVGTTVHFTLPQAAEPVEIGTGCDAAGAAGAPTVLVCDDDAGIVEQFCTLLQAHGYHPVGVTDGARAVELARTDPPDVVVLDLLMPSTTGAQVVGALRESPATRRVPVVVISGLGPESDATTARYSEEWLIKPVSEGRLVRAVSMAVSGRPAGGSVLLVEDDEPLARVLIEMLAEPGLRVVHATSASEAVVLGADLNPDVMILDLTLGDGNGHDVVAEFSRRWTLADTSLVVYSAADVAPEQREELRLGTTVFLTKSRTTPEQLRDQVLGLLRAVAVPASPSASEGSSRWP